MAVKDEIFHGETEDLILSSPRNFYRAPTYAEHWQLRSMMAVTMNGIYYCSRDEVFRLDPVKRTRELVASVSFTPRCLTAMHGWICCGGDRGDFAIISVHESSRRMLESGAAVDARLDIDDHMRRPEYQQDTRNPNSASTTQRPTVSISKVGRELVNCVTIWFPQRDLEPETYQMPVAVLSNNDSTVSIVDLCNNDEIQQIQLDDCVNRALISPDGQLLITVGDGPYMHIFTREATSKEHINSKPKTYHWVENDRIQLPGQQWAKPKSGTEEPMRGTFAAAFSPTGRYLAVGTQFGAIQIFDTRYLANSQANPVVACCSSTRPRTPSGAIRVLEFSAEPIDLLAVTEDTGRVFIIDVRKSFNPRQIVELDPHADGVLRVGVTDRPLDSLIDPLLRGSQSTSDVLSSINDTERRQLYREMMGRNNPPLTQEETAVLEALRQQRVQRENLRELGAEVARERSSALAQARERATEQSEERSVTPLYDSAWTDSDRPSLTLPQSLRDFVSGRNSTDSLRAYIAERNQDRERRGQAPRRRGSIMLATAATALEREQNSQRDREREREREREEREERLESEQYRSRIGLGLPRIGSDSPNNPWAELEALYNLAVEPSGADPTARMRIEIESDSARAERNRRLTAALNRSESRLESRNEQPRHYVRLAGSGSGITALSVGSVPGSRSRNGGIGSMTASTRANSSPQDTTGVAWSKDGKILYVGTEGGIHELHVDVQARKFHSAITMR